MFDTHTAHRSRAYLDLLLRTTTGMEDQSSAILTLTNVWSDQPEVVQRTQGAFTFNGENRFFVDVAQYLGGAVVWYRYWWFDSHRHNWWWYGPYQWWYWRYNWFGYGWSWWQNWWWPYWHWYHWYGWSSSWEHLIPSAQFN